MGKDYKFSSGVCLRARPVSHRVYGQGLRRQQLRRNQKTDRQIHVITYEHTCTCISTIVEFCGSERALTTISFTAHTNPSIIPLLQTGKLYLKELSDCPRWIEQPAKEHILNLSPLPRTGEGLACTLSPKEGRAWDKQETKFGRRWWDDGSKYGWHNLPRNWPAKCPTQKGLQTLMRMFKLIMSSPVTVQTARSHLTVLRAPGLHQLFWKSFWKKPSQRPRLTPVPQFPSPLESRSLEGASAPRKHWGKRLEEGRNRERLKGPYRSTSPQCWSGVTPRPLLPLCWTSRASPPSISPSAVLGPASSLPTFLLSNVSCLHSNPSPWGTDCLWTEAGHHFSWSSPVVLISSQTSQECLWN